MNIAGKDPHSGEEETAGSQDVMNWSTTSITSFGPATLDNQKAKPMDLATRPINSVKDIEGASSEFKFNRMTNKPDMYDTSDVAGSKPKTLRTGRNVMDTSLYVDDIDGARTFIKDKMLRTGRHVDPLAPRYQLPGYEMFPHDTPKFMRDTLDVSDVDGAMPKVPRKFAPRESMPNDIEGSQACWRPRHRRARLDAPPGDIMRTADITATSKPLDITSRRTNPIAPEYTIYGNYIHDDPKFTKPKHLPAQIFNGHLLQTQDVNDSSKAWQPHMRREYRNLTSTADIEGAQADTVIHSIVTKRETNPLLPTYQALDRDQLLIPPVIGLMPADSVTRPTINPTKDTGPPMPSSSGPPYPMSNNEAVPAPGPVSYSARMDYDATAPRSGTQSARNDDLEPAPFTDFVAPVQTHQAPPASVGNLDLSRTASGSALMAADPSARGGSLSAKSAPKSGVSGGRKSTRAYDQYDPKPAPVSGGARSGRAPLTGRSGGAMSSRAKQSARDRDEEIRSVRDL